MNEPIVSMKRLQDRFIDLSDSFTTLKECKLWEGMDVSESAKKALAFEFAGHVVSLSGTMRNVDYSIAEEIADILDADRFVRGIVGGSNSTYSAVYADIMRRYKDLMFDYADFINDVRSESVKAGFARYVNCEKRVSIGELSTRK